jgi:hypothetical protein
MEDGSIIILLIICAVPSMLIGAAIGSARGRMFDGAVLSLFLGPIGWLLVFTGNDYRHKCFACKKAIAEDALICPYCRTATHAQLPTNEVHIVPESPVIQNFEYWVHENDDATGPAPLREIIARLNMGELTRDTKVQKVGGTIWVKLGSII